MKLSLSTMRRMRNILDRLFKSSWHGFSSARDDISARLPPGSDWPLRSTCDPGRHVDSESGRDSALENEAGDSDSVA